VYLTNAVKTDIGATCIKLLPKRYSVQVVKWNGVQGRDTTTWLFLSRNATA